MLPRAAKTPRARAAPPPPTPLDDELIQWDATPLEDDEYAANPASDLAGFVHALSGDEHHHDRRSCGLATMLGSEEETAPPDAPPPPSTWEDGPRRRGASRPPLAENTVPLKRGAPSVSSQSPARRPPPSKVSRASDAALDAAFLEFDLAAAAPPSKPPPPRPRPPAQARAPPPQAPRVSVALYSSTLHCVYGIDIVCWVKYGFVVSK